MTTEHAVPGAASPTIDPVSADTAQVAQAFGVVPETGLSAQEAKARLESMGANRLSETAKESGLKAFLRQYQDFMQVILLVAAVVNQIVTQETGTTVLLAGLTVFNAVIGLRQESKAEESVKALAQMMKTIARVRRDGQAVEIDAQELVPGDVVLVEAGNLIPADGRIYLAATLEIEEAALTGESLPVGKSVEPVMGEDVPLGDRTCMAYMNTSVTRGRGEMIVTATGMKTEIGHIANMLASAETSKTPLQKQLDSLSKIIASIAGVALLLVLMLGLARGESFDTLFVTGVALAVAAIPTGLPAVVTALLSMGTREIANRHAIVKRLPAVETLGSTSAICSDKTGTLTLNKMTARQLLIPGQNRYTVSGEGYSTVGEITHVGGQNHDLDPYLLPMVLCADAVLDGESLIGDPTEGALIVLGAKGGLDIAGTRSALPRVAEVPFDSDYKFMATFHEMTADDGRPVVRCYVKGAPDVLIARATTFRSPDGTLVPITPDNQHLALEANDQIANAGERVMVVAQRDLDPQVLQAGGDLIDHVRDLTLLAMVGIVDPPRAEAKAAIAECRDAGIRVRMITGDHATTAAAIATELGIPGRAVTGHEFASMTDEELLGQLDDIGVIARVAPEDKVRLVTLLKRMGNVVAMTGDGVNDAPALKTADIGVAMGITGTEVSKQAAVMILTDDNFATIVGAVSYGRTLYDNLLKYLRFQMSTLVAYIAVFLAAGVLDIANGSPLNPLQILWLNMVVDIPLAIALGFDQPARGLMARPPRPMSAPVLSRANWIRLCIQGAVMTDRGAGGLPDRRRPGGRRGRRDDAAHDAVAVPPGGGAAVPRPGEHDLRPGRTPGRDPAATLRARAPGDHPHHQHRLPATHLRHHRPDLRPVVHLHRPRRLARRRRRADQAHRPTPPARVRRRRASRAGPRPGVRHGTTDALDALRDLGGRHTRPRDRPSTPPHRRRPGRAAAVALEPERVRRRAPVEQHRGRDPPARGPVGAEQGQHPALGVLRLRPGHPPARPARRDPEPRQRRLGAARLGRLRHHRPGARERRAGRAVVQRPRPLRRRPGRGPPDPAGRGDGPARPPVRRLRPRRARRGARRARHPPGAHRHRGRGAGRPRRGRRAHRRARPARPGAQAAGRMGVRGAVRRAVRDSAAGRLWGMTSLSDFSAAAIDGTDTDLAQYDGKVVLVVNTASQCGFTGQYKGLQQLQDSYADQGLVVLGFPCDQFGNQEPGDEAEISDFCERNFGVTFPLFSKVDVNGDDAHPLFEWLKDSKGGLLGSKIKWNFTKFLVGRDGQVIDRYAPQTEPEKLSDDIEKAL